MVYIKARHVPMKWDNIFCTHITSARKNKNSIASYTYGLYFSASSYVRQATSLTRSVYGALLAAVLLMSNSLKMLSNRMTQLTQPLAAYRTGLIGPFTLL